MELVRKIGWEARFIKPHTTLRESDVHATLLSRHLFLYISIEYERKD